ncbi:MAG: CPBP family intramembrane metalloprotease [Bacteroidetes bacterium]|nr:CPBP family intramembrane metalloprotease [Bacteroidota bacterium]
MSSIDEFKKVLMIWPPGLQLLLLLLLAFTGVSFALLIADVILEAFFGVANVQALLLDLDEDISLESINALKVFNMITSAAFFLFSTLVFAWITQEDGEEFLKIRTKPGILLPVVGVVLMIMTIPSTIWLGELNNAMSFPASMKAIEDFLRTQEEETQKIYELFLKVGTTQSLYADLIIMAAIPALGEELFFRAGIQQLFTNWTKKPFLAILFTAVLFSAIHGQFFGFLPRVFLGMVLGYLFLWSNNLWVSIIAHFCYNSFLILMVYMYQKEVINYNIDSADAFPAITVLISIPFIFGLLYWLYNVSIRK